MGRRATDPTPGEREFAQWESSVAPRRASLVSHKPAAGGAMSGAASGSGSSVAKEMFGMSESLQSRVS